MENGDILGASMGLLGGDLHAYSQALWIRIWKNQQPRILFGFIILL